MNKFLYFQTAANDAAAFPVADVIAIHRLNGNGVAMYFARGSGLMQSVALTVALADEEAVVKAITQACSGMSNLKNAAIVVADDQNSTYLHPGITAVAAIGLDLAPSA